MRIGYSQRCAVVVVGGATVKFARRPTTMIIIGIVLALVGLAYLCWLLFALAVYALPLFAGQMALMTLRSPFIRAGIALLFAVPAAIAGYYAALGLAHIGIPIEGWRQAMALIGAIVVAATAWTRMMLSAPRPMPDKALPLP